MNKIKMPHNMYEVTIRRALNLTALGWLSVWFAIQPNIILDPDLGWHLRTGQWMLAHGAVTTTDPFSSYGQGKPWIAYSWLFELLLYGLYRLFGLAGIVISNVALSLGITLALLTLIRKLAVKTPTAIGLTALGVLALAPILNPRPWLFTILFFILELDLLLTARRTGQRRPLFWLPPLFAVWANIHIQFIYGFIPLGLFLLEPYFEQLFRRPFSWQNLRTSAPPFHWLVAALCFLATLVTPYHVRLYLPIIEYIQKTGAYRYVTELQTLDFRSPTHWLIPAFALGAAFVLGWRREAKPFSLLLLLIGTFLVFRSGRDLWFPVVVSLSIIASSQSAPHDENRFVVTKPQALLAAILLSLGIYFMARNRSLSEARLQNELAKDYPTAAAQVVEERGYVGPLYNHFNWGGYLIWRLPHLPVSMDGRTNLHGDKRIERSIKTWGGAAKWAEDAELAAAGLVIADVNLPLASLLSCDSRFELVYQDAVAAVFIARKAIAPAK